MRKINKVRKCLFGAALLALPVQTAHAENYAFLVGASDYKVLASTCVAGKGCDLRGPKNDIAAMWNVLVQNGFAKGNMIVLADHLAQNALKSDIEADGLPTRHEIMTRLRKLAKKVGRGDFVYLHFSGHGAMQPDQNGDETDGMDEVFLPIDMGYWDKKSGAIKNAIVDDELAVLLKIMTGRGAKVFAVFDQCNAGTVTRGAGEPGVQERALSASDLRIPPAALQQAKNKVLAKRRQRGQGDTPPVNNLFSEAPDIVSFYAVHPGESAREQRLPRGALHSLAYISGAFSFSIARALGSNSPKSYHDLARIIQNSYSALGYSETPLFEGDLNRLVFGRSSIPRQLTARLSEDDLFLDGGLLQGVTTGSMVSLFQLVSDPQKRDRDRKGGYLGEARVVEVNAIEAALELVSGADGKEPDPSLFPYKMWAEISSHTLSLELRVALPSKAALQNSPHGERLQAALEQLKKQEPERKSGVVIIWVKEGEAADFRLRPDDDELHLASSAQQTGMRARDPVVSLTAKGGTVGLAAKISKALQQLGKSRNILRLADQPGGSCGLADALDIRAFITHEKAPLPLKSADGPPDNRACEAYDQNKVLARKNPVEPGATITARHCDIPVFELRNKGHSTIDVTGIYMDRAGGISLIYPFTAVRLEPGQGVKGGQAVHEITQIITWNIKTNRPSTIGLEHVVFLAVEHKKGKPPSELSDFSFLPKPALPVSERRGGTRRAGSNLLDQLKSIAFPQGRTRNGLEQSEKCGEIRLFPVQVRADKRQTESPK